MILEIIFMGIGANSGLVLSCFGTSDAFKFNVGLTTTTSKESNENSK